MGGIADADDYEEVSTRSVSLHCLLIDLPIDYRSDSTSCPAFFGDRN
jgi:hypothetical protein